MLCAGTRFGKSLCAARDVEPLILSGKTRGWIVAPNYGLGEKEFRYIYQDLVEKLRLPTSSCHYDARSGNMSITFAWGAEVVVKSCDNPESLLGEEVDWMILSEASKIKKDIFDRYLWGRLMSRRGVCIIPTTPSGYDHFVYPFYMRGIDPKNHAEVQSWQFASWDNPLIDRREIEMARSILGKEYFEEQYEGRFVSFSGRVYKEFNVETHTCDPFEIPRTWDRYRAIDYGVTAPFVCLWFAVNPQGEVFLYDEHYQTNRTLSYHAAEIDRKTGTNYISTTYIDPSAGIKIDLCSTYNIPCIDADNDVPLGISRVKEYLKIDAITEEPKMKVFKNCTNVIREMMQYCYPESTDENNTKDKPMKKDDHSMDCVRYFIASRPTYTGVNFVKPMTEGTFEDAFNSLLYKRDLNGIIGNEYVEDSLYA